MSIELPASLVEQLPVAAQSVLCAALAGRHAARLAEPIVVDWLVAGQERVRRQLVEALERNTSAWRDTCAPLVRLEAAVTAQKSPGLSRRGSPGLNRREGPGRSRRASPGLIRRARPARPRKEVDAA